MLSYSYCSKSHLLKKMSSNALPLAIYNIDVPAVRISPMLIYSWNEYEIYKNGLKIYNNGLKANNLFRGGWTLWWEDENPTL